MNSTTPCVKARDRPRYPRLPRSTQGIATTLWATTQIRRAPLPSATKYLANERYRAKVKHASYLTRNEQEDAELT